MPTILQKNIIKDLGLDILPEKEQEEALLNISRIVFQSVLIRIMEKLKPKEKEEFAKILKERPNDEEAILNFLQKKVPNLNEIVNEEVAKFKKESLEFVKKIKK